MRKIVNVGLAAQLALVLSVTSLTAQEGHHSHPSGLGAVIDGSRNPELIPDAIAWRLYLRAVAEPPDAGADQLKALRAKLSPLELSEADFEVSRRVLATFNSEITQAEERIQAIGRAAPGSPRYREAVALHKSVEQLIVDTRGTLEAGLSPRGAARLRQQVLEAKRDMKIVPVIQPASNRNF